MTGAVSVDVCRMVSTGEEARVDGLPKAGLRDAIRGASCGTIKKEHGVYQFRADAAVFFRWMLRAVVLLIPFQEIKERRNKSHGEMKLKHCIIENICIL